MKREKQNPLKNFQALRHRDHRKGGNEVAMPEAKRDAVLKPHCHLIATFTVVTVMHSQR